MNDREVTAETVDVDEIAARQEGVPGYLAMVTKAELAAIIERMEDAERCLGDIESAAMDLPI